MFKRGFKTKGMIPLTTFLRVYKVGDIVYIKANAAQQKGMPHKYYHGFVCSLLSVAFLADEIHTTDEPVSSTTLPLELLE